MKTASVLIAVVAVISAEVEGRNLVVNQPRATGTAVLPDDGVSPKPTSPPGLDHLPPGGMFRRAPPSIALLTAMIAPDNTCGWISASVAVPYTCGSGASCGLVLAQKTFSGVVMCFNDVAYNFRFGCIDYNSYFLSSACDHLCAENTQVMKCTKSAMPYCNTIAFPGGVTDYWCNSINYSTAQLAHTTWRGQTDARIYTRIVQPLTSSAVFFSTPRSVTDRAPTATNAEDSVGASETGGVGNGNGNGSGSGSGSGRGRKTPVGAIVGGVVGGVAAIALGLGLLALFLFLRRKKSKAAAGQTETPPSNLSPMQTGASPGMPMTQAYHDPKFSASPPPPQEYPPQQQYPPHTTPPPQGGYYPQQSLGPSSPTASHMTDPRMSHVTTSPTPTPTPANAYATPPPDQLPQPQPQQQQPGGFQPVPGQQHYGQRPHTQAPPPAGPVHEAPAQTGDNHRGQMHELG